MLLAWALAVVAVVIAAYFRVGQTPPTDAPCSGSSTSESIHEALLTRHFLQAKVGHARGNPATIHYKVLGAANDKESNAITTVRLLILQGLGARGDMWARVGNDVLDSAAKTNSSVRVECLLLDNRGVGLSTTESSMFLGRYTTRLLAEDALELLDMLGWTHGIHVLGHSMGGMIALELATLASERLRTLTIASSSNIRQQIYDHLSNFSFFEVMKLKSILTAKPQCIEAKLRVNIEQMHGSVIHGDKDRYEELYDTKLQQKLRFGWNGFRSFAGRFGQISAIITHHVEDARLHLLARKHLKIVVLGGVEDKVILQRNANRLAKPLVRRDVECIHRAFASNSA